LEFYLEENVMSRKEHRERRTPPARKPRHFQDSPHRAPGAPARSVGDYKKEKYILAIMEAEKGIYESFIASDRQLTDAEVGRALRRLATDLLEQGYQPVEDSGQVKMENRESLLLWCIRRNWSDLFRRQPRHSDEDLAGLLRVPLDSLEVWVTPEPDSRGYLYYLEGFITHTGVKVQPLDVDGRPIPEEDTEEIRLMALGRNWLLRSNEAAGRAFRQRVEELLAEKKPGPVIHACQYLIGYTGDNDVIQRLHPFLTPAYRQLGVPFGMGRR
jgi:hypothetical protein